MLSVVINGVMLSIVILNSVLLSVVMPYCYAECFLSVFLMFLKLGVGMLSVAMIIIISVASC
jgi:hypothetical protein